MRRPSPPVEIVGGPGQITITGPAGRWVTVYDERGTTYGRRALDDFGRRLAGLGVTDRLAGHGGLVVRDLPPGSYRVRVGRSRARPVHVLRDDELPEDYDDRIRNQRLDPGFGYVETRDGTTLSLNIALPDPQIWGPPPYPTLIQYSAYADSRPDALTGRVDLDDTMNTEANAALHLGFALVGLNARGTGASGGSFRMWDRVHGLDGYDAVEAVAAQTWCSRVGMVGRSGPGFTQLLVAACQPPSLAAITPAAVISRWFGTGSRPGGLPNTWVIERLSGWTVEPTPGAPTRAHPPRYAPGGWDDWVVQRLRTTDDPTGLANQLLRGQTVDPYPDLALTEHRDPEKARRVEPAGWAPRVTCPTMLIGSWQDQESGPGWPDLMDWFPATTEVHLVGSNGTHEEGRYPEVVALWAEFLAEHVAGRSLRTSAGAEAYLRAAIRPQLGEQQLPLVPPRREGRVSLRLENGAGGVGRGMPEAALRLDLPAWPPEVTHWRLHLWGDRSAMPQPPSRDRVLCYRYDPSSRPPNAAPADREFDVNAPNPPYDWRPPPEGHGLLFMTEPVDHDQILCGPSSVDLRVRCSAPDVDLEVCLTELRPDGWETYIQAGWLRLSMRRLDPDHSTELKPVPTFLEEDVAPLVLGSFEPVRVAIPEVAHVLRAGSRLGLRIEAPGGTQPSWTFGALWPAGTSDGDAVVVEIRTGPSEGSGLVVPLLHEKWVPERLPPLPSPGVLRRQPTRWVGVTAHESAAVSPALGSR